MDPGETLELSFEWGLGISSNNTTEAYALLQGLRSVKESKIQSLIVVGDSKLIIGKMISNASIGNNLLDSVLDRAKKEASKFFRINFFQVLRENNQIKDRFANNATLIKEGIININGDVYDLPIP